MLYTLESIPRLYPIAPQQLATAVVTGQLSLAAYGPHGPEVSVYALARWLKTQRRTSPG